MAVALAEATTRSGDSLTAKHNEVIMNDRDARLQEVARIAIALEAQTGCPAQLLIA